MTAFIVANVTIKDEEKFKEYDLISRPILTQYGGEPVLKGIANEALDGDLDHWAVGIAKFPSQEALLAWHNSDEYQAIIPLRDEACDMKVITYSILD